VGILASDAHREALLAETHEEALAPVPGYAEAARAAARDGARIVLMPELITAVREPWRAALDAELAGIARQHGVDLVVGLGDFARRPPANVAVVITPDGAQRDYEKRHLVPGLEGDFVAGGGVLSTERGLGVAICKDLDFQDISRDYSRAGVRVLLVPAWDKGTDAEIHRRMAIVRAVEGGFALVRSAREGYLSAHDAWGRLLAERRSHEGGGVAALVVDVPVVARRTLFPWTHRGFGIAMIAMAVVLGAIGARRASI
jgi:apolipoprotein N-acyltransferase